MILRQFFSDLPKDARTLMKTPRKIHAKDLGDGQYHHFGLVAGLEKALKSVHAHLVHGCDKLCLQLNVDGLPLFKSCATQFWPILCRMCKPFASEPFIISLYCGRKKPENVDDYLNDFIEEMTALQQDQDYVNIKGFGRFQVQIDGFISDAPARAYLKQIKSHSGYFSCEKCVQKGAWQRKVFFPQTDATKRTDVRFDNMTDQEHHIGRSPLLRLSLGLVSHFPLEYMHLVCLGVMHRLIFYWVKSPVGKGLRLGQRIMTEISQNLDALCISSKEICKEM
jgi:hypothetical protein